VAHILVTKLFLDGMLKDIQLKEPMSDEFVKIGQMFKCEVSGCTYRIVKLEEITKEVK
jgi:hypothetical protein